MNERTQSSRVGTAGRTLQALLLFALVAGAASAESEEPSVSVRVQSVSEEASRRFEIRVGASDGTRLPASAGGDERRAAGRRPRAMSPELRVARDLALRRLRERAKCRGLFEAEGADGIQLLNRARFRLATATERVEICRRRGAALFTTVRGTEIGVCPREFGELASRHRAAIVLHEALHHAGVTERPFDPRALSPTELTRLVERRCYL